MKELTPEKLILPFRQLEMMHIQCHVVSIHARACTHAHMSARTRARLLLIIIPSQFTWYFQKMSSLNHESNNLKTKYFSLVLIQTLLSFMIITVILIIFNERSLIVLKYDYASRYRLFSSLLLKLHFHSRQYFDISQRTVNTSPIHDGALC